MDPVLLRFLERITAVVIGGMAVYFGFRLFQEVPEHKDGTGKFVLPWDISIVMTKIGPGVFFALFGVGAVCLALIRPLEISSQRPKHSGEEEEPSIYYVTLPSVDQTARSDARALLRREIAVLNTIPSLLRPNLPEHELDSIKRRIARVKLLLIRPVWGNPEEGFGDISKFEHWVRTGEPDPPPIGINKALLLYRYGTKEVDP